MKLFIGQAVSGEDIEKLYEEMEEVYKALDKVGHNYYCTLKEDENEFQKKTKKQIMEHAFKEIDSSDAFLAIIRSDKKSTGLLIEVDYVLGKGKKLIVAVKKGVKDYVPDLADEVIEWEDFEDLINKLGELK